MKIFHMKSAKRFYVIYFNGFSLKGEEALFSSYLLENDTTVAGFSYGAQKALEYVYQNTTQRIDRLILLSPAFFQTQKPSFIRTQLRYFNTDKEAYIKQFLQNASKPSSIDLSPYVHIGTQEELEALLTYTWEKEKIQSIINRDIAIEVFLGKKDKIIPIDEAIKFFTHTTHYIIKDAGHILRRSDG